MLSTGIIACAHGNHKAVARLRRAYEKNNADAIALCGDLGDNYKEISLVLKSAQGKMPLIAFPGSHEPINDYYRAIKKTKAIDGTRQRRVTIKNHDIIILPGSWVNTPNAGFRIAESKKSRQKQYKLFPIKDLRRFIRNPAKTILLCHDPPHCANKQGIDVAYSGIVTKTFYTLTKRELAIYGKGQIIPQPEANRLARKKLPVSVKHRNVGIKQLNAFLRKNKIPFLACGHIHEAGQRAVNSSGKPLKQGEQSKTLWYNAAPGVNGRGGMLIIKDGKATYKNVKA